MSSADEMHAEYERSGTDSSPLRKAARSSARENEDVDDLGAFRDAEPSDVGESDIEPDAFGDDFGDAFADAHAEAVPSLSDARDDLVLAAALADIEASARERATRDSERLAALHDARAAAADFNEREREEAMAVAPESAASFQHDTAASHAAMDDARAATHALELEEFTASSSLETAAASAAELGALHEREELVRARHDADMAGADLAIAERDEECARLRRECERLTSELRAALSSGDDDKVVTAAQTVSDVLTDGQINGTDLDATLTEELQRSLAHALLRGQQRGPEENRQQRGRGRGNTTTTPKMVAFLGVLLCIGGPRVCGLVSKAFGGPEAETVQGWRSDAPRIQMGISENALVHNFDNVVWPLMGKLGLQSCMFGIGEDGTSAQKRIDVVSAGGDVIVHGLNGGALRMESVEQLAQEMTARGLSSALYVISLIPQIAGAPAIPLLVDANDNSFTRADVHRATVMILKHFALRGLAGRVVFGVSDGDGRLRDQQLTLGYHHESPAERYISFDHPLIQMRLPWIVGSGYYLQTSDWMHITWRLRLLFLSPKRELHLGDVELHKKHLDMVRTLARRPARHARVTPLPA